MYVKKEMIKLSMAFSITSGHAAVLVTTKTYNAWCAWHSDKDSATHLKTLVRAYEESKNIAADSSWQTDNHHKVGSKEALNLAMAASPTKEMHL